MAMVETDNRVATAMRLMEYSISDAVRVEDIASRLNLSMHHFHRDFLAKTGETPGSYLRRIRLDAAAQGLQWTRLPVGAIAYNLGYQSQASFTRAFATRFGVTPNSYRFRFGVQEEKARQGVGTGRVFIREIEKLHLLARRYVGDVNYIRESWEDLIARLPERLHRPGSALYVGQMHDDPRITPASQMRYDCSITVTGDFPHIPRELAELGLYRTTIQPGRYACIEVCGTRWDVESHYRTLIAHCIRHGELILERPALEIHTIPRCEQDPGNLSFRLLMPIY